MYVSQSPDCILETKNLSPKLSTKDIQHCILTLMNSRHGDKDQAFIVPNDTLQFVFKRLSLPSRAPLYELTPSS